MLTSFHSAVIEAHDFEVGVRDTSLLLGRDPLRLEVARADGRRSALFELANTVLELRAPACDVGAASDQNADESAGEDAEDAAPRVGLAGIRFACEAREPGDWLAARGVPVAACGAFEASFDDGRGVRRFRSARVGLEASRGLPVELIAGEALEAGPSKAGAGESGTRCDPAACVRALDHVVVLSPAAEATRRFYGDQLGLRLALDKTFEARGVRLIFFRIGGVTVEVGARLAATDRPERADRFGGLAWQVVDLDAIHARLTGEGFDVSEIRSGHKPGTRVCTVREPVQQVPTLLIEPVG